jgi:hypothetical protein
VSDELERKHPASDEGKEEGEDFEAHRKHPMTDEGEEADDDVEAHRQHGGVGRQHGGA